MNTYIAAPFIFRDQAREFGKSLERYGYKMIARWYNEHALPNPNEGFDHPDNLTYAQRAAQEDLEDVAAAELCIVITAPGVSPTHGRLVELGYALALCGEVWIVGDVENVFCVLQGFVDVSGSTVLVRRFPSLEAVAGFVARGERV